MHNSFKAAFFQHVSLSNSDVYCNSQSPFYLRGDGRNADLGELQHSAGNELHHLDASDLSRSSMYNGMKASSVSVESSNLQFGGGLTNSMGSSGRIVDTGQFLGQKGGNGISGFVGNGQFENWGDKYSAASGSGGVAAPDHSHLTDTSTETTDGKNQFPGVNHERLVVNDSIDQSKGKNNGDQKALCRLAQNREAARKSRMRKRAYVQQLEDSRQRLVQLEQDVKRARLQGLSVATGLSGDQSHSMGGSGPMAFDIDYARWLDEHQRLINDLRSAVNSHVGDTELQPIVDKVMSHHDEIFRIKSAGVKSDMFHILFGMWKTPVERCFMWLGGFRSSDVLKVLGNQIEPLTEQQLVGICNLQQSSQQAEDALSQGVEALQQSLVDTLSANSLAPRNSGNISDYMGQMAIAMSKLATLENFLHQANLLRLQTLQQMHRILTTRQAARALLAINDYKSRLRALSSLWLARPKG
ncbi:transcription factor hbp-1b(c38) [Phtheirospermum japonicum]|uniref:Transcription factor hbp-1b(C38) n=1 Tax=Phtheirospermum japonicum TaxID=374723 RepID=A0A830CBQ0_9LAMI|nr:transcription factor hbp-1b(c38) [Phtheirospermum japonicum]